MFIKKFKSQSFLNSKTLLFTSFPKFNFAQKMPVQDGRAQVSGAGTSVNVQPWVDIENRLSKLRGELVLNNQDKIEDYIMGVIKGYFRTTYKDGLKLTSNLSDHGLDSLDAIEIAMVMEDELGNIFR